MRNKEDGRRKKEEGTRKKEEGRRKKEDGRRKNGEEKNSKKKTKKKNKEKKKAPRGAPAFFLASWHIVRCVLCRLQQWHPPCLWPASMGCNKLSPLSAMRRARTSVRSRARSLPIRNLDVVAFSLTATTHRHVAATKGRWCPW